ncbi:tripartite tricarboxylate transporter TctB family protein [Actinoplanes sp. NPDC051861]|uniref:tripartite tricarboxylate transporter TctB family protein n=1 Tax=Actinoplanes sp. NPDC051861 TaxID=3155170 RepID=UPI00343ABDD1
MTTPDPEPAPTAPTPAAPTPAAPATGAPATGPHATGPPATGAPATGPPAAAPAGSAALSDLAEPPAPESAERERSQARASALLGIVMVAGAIVVLVDAAGMRETDAAVGPAAAPTLIGILLGILGLVLAVQGVRSARTPDGLDLDPRRFWRLAAMVGTLIAFALLLPFVGYVVSSAALFTVAALLLGAPHPARVVAYGWALAATVFLIFDRLIGLSLPTGPWGF